jgi:hypothetical protein
MRINMVGVTVLWLAAVSAGSRADTILQDQGSSAIQVNHFEPIGQSFTAEDPHIAFAFDYTEFNPSFPNDPLQLRLLAGDGLGGIALATVMFAVPAAYEGFFDVDLSSVTLTVGQLYTAELTVPGTSPYFGVWLSDDNDVYPGGRAYFFDHGGNITPSPNDDMRFRVTPIPEPVGSLLAVAGLAAIGCVRPRGTALRPSSRSPGGTKGQN